MKKPKKMMTARERENYRLKAITLLENNEYEQDLIKYGGEPLNAFSPSFFKHYEFLRKYDIAKPYNIDRLKRVKDGKGGLVEESLKIVSQLDPQELYRSEVGYVYIKINPNAPKEIIMFHLENIITIYQAHTPEKKTRFRVEQREAFQVWEKRKPRIGFKEIAKEMGIKVSTAKAKYYRAYELIYKKRYNPVEHEKPEIKKEYLKKECSTCPEKTTCKDICPDALRYVNQDAKTYQRELIPNKPITIKK